MSLTDALPPHSRPSSLLHCRHSNERSEVTNVVNESGATVGERPLVTHGHSSLVHGTHAAEGHRRACDPRETSGMRVTDRDGQGEGRDRSLSCPLVPHPFHLDREARVPKGHRVTRTVERMERVSRAFRRFVSLTAGNRRSLILSTVVRINEK